MSVEKVVEKKSEENYRGDSQGVVDLEVKLMEVGSQKYTVEMRQNNQSKFFRICETTPEHRSNRVVVPMSFYDFFHAKLTEILGFCSSYTPSNISEKKYPRDRTTFAKSVSTFSPGGRRYYFDVIDAQGTLTLRLSYVFNGHRESVRILVEALPNLIEIIDGFNKKYPSTSPMDDFPAQSSYRRRNTNQRGGSSRPSRGFRGGFRGDFSRGYRHMASGAPAPHYNGKGPQGEKSETKRPGALKVVTEPAPCTIVSGVKKFLFEYVEGTNTFLRITESINDNYKSSLHVPIEAIGQLQAVILDMNKKYMATREAEANNKA